MTNSDMKIEGSEVAGLNLIGSYFHIGTLAGMDVPGKTGYASATTG